MDKPTSSQLKKEYFAKIATDPSFQPLRVFGEGPGGQYCYEIMQRYDYTLEEALAIEADLQDRYVQLLNSAQ